VRHLAKRSRASCCWSGFHVQQVTSVVRTSMRCGGEVYRSSPRSKAARFRADACAAPRRAAAPAAACSSQAQQSVGAFSPSRMRRAGNGGGHDDLQRPDQPDRSPGRDARGARQARPAVSPATVKAARQLRNPSLSRDCGAQRAAYREPADLAAGLRETGLARASLEDHCCEEERLQACARWHARRDGRASFDAL